MTERKKVLRAVGGSIVLYAGAFVVLSLGGYARSVYVVVGGAALLTVGAVVLQLTLNRARSQSLLARLRVWLPVAAAVAQRRSPALPVDEVVRFDPAALQRAGSSVG